MTIREVIKGKISAARTIWRMFRQLYNWRPVWLAYRSDAPIPALRFRRGFTLHHGKWDAPVLMLHEIFGDQLYTQDLKSAPDGVIIDIGANIGAAVLDFASRFPRVEIHAYEPNPSTFESLRRNVLDNGLGQRVKLFNEAVAATSGTFELWADMLSVSCTGYLHEPHPGATRISVPCVDMRTVFERAGNRKISLLKIDAEGAEVDLLKSGAGSVLAPVEYVAVECHDQLVPDALSQCWAALASSGFQCRLKPVAPHAGVNLVLGHKTVAFS